MKSLLLLFALTLSSASASSIGRIVGGSEVNPPHSMPFVASLRNAYTGAHEAGASVLDENRVVTAAHVCSRFLEQDLQVVAGEHDLATDEGTEQVRNIIVFDIHPNYDSLVNTDDICIVNLETPLVFNNAVGAIALPSPGDAFVPGSNAVVAGWGQTNNGGQVSDTLQRAEIQIRQDTDCSAEFENLYVPELMICAGGSGAGPCNDDGGGPMICDGKLCGIVSFGTDDCGQDPTVYTKVAHYVPWINGDQP